MSPIQNETLFDRRIKEQLMRRDEAALNEISNR